MKKTVITFDSFNRFTEPMVAVDSFQFRKDKKWHWLQRVCIYLLTKIGAFRQYDEERIEHVTFDDLPFIENILRHKWNVEDVFDIELDRIIIGGKDFEKLLASPDIKQYFQFQAGKQSRFLDLAVEVVPWMNGIVVLPRKSYER